MNRPGIAIVNIRELGSNCWLPKRFIEGSRCDRVMCCKYPEKKTCKTVDAEIRYLRDEALQQLKISDGKIAYLTQERERL